MFRSGIVRLLRVFAAVDGRLTTGVFALGITGGLLLPAFTVATGALAGRLRDGGSATGAVVALGVLFTVQRLLDPITTELSGMLMRRVDEALTQRVMLAMAVPPGLAHVEDPTVLDAAQQAQGALTGFTPGAAALQLPFLIKRRVWCWSSLLIIGAYRWWLVPLLGAVYWVLFRNMKRHNDEVTLIMHGNADRLRRAYYLRTLALTHRVAKETRVFGLAPWFVDRYRDSWLRVMGDVWGRRREYWPEIVWLTALVAGVEALAFWLVSGDAIAGELSVGAAVTLTQALVAAAVAAQFDWANVGPGEANLALDKLEYLERCADDATHKLHGDRVDTAGLPSRTIRFEDVRFTYPGRAEPVFDGFDLEIEAGRSLAIVGENGAGKTTFVKLLARLYDPDAGRITIDGVDLRQLDPAAWRRRLAPVFQDFLQLEVSAYDNVAFGALEHADERDAVVRAAALAGALPLVERLAGGWDTVLSRKFSGGTQLSGGEWQRLALARALFAVQCGAGVLVLDEPTAAMDVRGEAEIYDRFLELTRGVTTIVISHRFSTVRRADRIVVVEHGRIVEDGSHTELLTRGGTYASMYKLQAARFQAETNA